MPLPENINEAMQTDDPQIPYGKSELSKPVPEEVKKKRPRVKPKYEKVKYKKKK
jgi:hypothetical protein